MYVYVSFCTYIQDKSVTMLSVCAQRYIQIQTCRIPDVPLHLGPHPLITAHAIDHFIYVPSFQAGPRPRPDSDSPDSMITSPIRRGLLPVPDSEGPSALGPALLLRTAPCHGTEDPEAPSPLGPARVCVGGKWAGDAGVGSARADGSGGWEGDEVW